MPGQYQALLFAQHGKPTDVLRIVPRPLPEPGSGEVLIRVIAAPINPSDLNVLEGSYGILPQLPATPGNEGVGMITAIGANVSTFQIGQKVVIPPLLGSWQEYVIARADDIISVPDTVNDIQAATLSINPPTAHLLLSEFVALQPGDWIIQNAAHSMVGIWVILLAHLRGIHTINFCRSEESLSKLQKSGADLVLIEGTDPRPQIRELCGGEKPVLGLNAVGGESATLLAKALGESGTLITYGGMSRQPVRLPTSLLIFNDLQSKGFWLAKWRQRNTSDAYRKLMQDVFKWVAELKWTTPISGQYPLKQYRDAIEHAQQSGHHGKVLFSFL